LLLYLLQGLPRGTEGKHADSWPRLCGAC
jgi:hypothetical protein